jgi:hypothetical protein
MTGVAVRENFAYLGVGSQGLIILDVTNPASPLKVGIYDTPGNAKGVAVAGDYVLIADSTALRIINVTKPAQPTEASSVPLNSPKRVRVAGNIAYVIHSNWYTPVDLVDISNPASPEVVGSYGRPDPSSGCSNEMLYYEDIAIVGDFAYLASDFHCGLEIADVSNPAAPVMIVGSDTTGWGAFGIAAEGDFVYLAETGTGLSVFRLLTQVTEEIPLTGGTLTSADGSTSVIFPSGAFTDAVYVTYKQELPGENLGELVAINHNFDLTAVYADTGQTANLAPGQTFIITVEYADSELGAAIEDSLAIFSWDGANWVQEATSVVDTLHNTISATPNHLSHWAVLGNTNQVFLPVVIHK